MDIVNMMKEGTIGSLSAVFNIAKIVIPLMIMMQFLKDLKVLDMISNFMEPMAKFFGISKKSTFPLVIGLILGLAYGAGVIINTAKEGELSKRDLYLVVIFLVACHSVIEDTLIFAAIGANGWLLLGTRLVIAILLTAFAGRHIDKIIKNL
ncbi:hypothetical protein HNR33_002869 [Brassicibacter mesophilus]